MTSKRLGDTEEGHSVTWRSRRSTFDGHRGMASVDSYYGDGKKETVKKNTEVIALSVIPEDLPETGGKFYLPGLPSATGQITTKIPAGQPPDYSGRSSESERSEIHSIQSGSWIDTEQDERRELTPSPLRIVHN
jgi:hypothetical protein